MKTLVSRLIIPVAVIICITITGSQLSYGQAESEAVKRENVPPEINVTKEGKVTCVFDNTDIRVVIKYFSDLTGENFIIDNKVRGTISVIAPTAFPVEEAIAVLESILEMQGYALVPSGDFIKVMSKKDASKRSILVIKSDDGSNEPLSDEVITRIIPLKYIDAQEARMVLGQFFSRDALVTAYPVTNVLIITDISSNIDRLEQLIKELDNPTGMTSDINTLILRYSKLTGKNIVVGKFGGKRVSIFSPDGLSDEELLNSMETIISTAGLKMEAQGDIIVIERDHGRAKVMEDPPDQKNRTGGPPEPRHSKRNG